MIEEVAELADEGAGRSPGEDAAGRAVDAWRVRSGHAAQEEVEDAGDVAVGVVVGQPPAQVAVQRDGVEQPLQRVVGPDRSASGRWSQAVSGSVWSPRRLDL